MARDFALRVAPMAALLLGSLWVMPAPGQYAPTGAVPNVALSADAPVPAPDTRPAPNTQPGAAARPRNSGNWWDNNAPVAPPRANPAMPPAAVGGGFNNPPMAPGNPAFAAGNNNFAPMQQPQQQQQNPYANSVTDYPSLQVHDWVMANAIAARARAMFHRAEDELNGSVKDAQFHFHHSRQYLDAIADEKHAYADYDAARQRKLASLKDDLKYGTILQLMREMNDKIAVQRAMKNIDHQDILAMATLKMQYASDARQMENALLAADSDVKAARDKMMAVSRRARDIRQGFDDSIRDNPRVLQARRNLEDARVSLIEAQAYVSASSLASDTALNYSYYLHRNDNGGVSGAGYGGYGSPYWGR
ncbi:MAG TPA: hypothetical protein VFC78_17280 [Tepidisphaeraceae bacterium]|nr:hypothetical protein [Tepidisphaeraceae bacterium]